MKIWKALLLISFLALAINGKFLSSAKFIRTIDFIASVAV